MHLRRLGFALVAFAVLGLCAEYSIAQGQRQGGAGKRQGGRGGQRGGRGGQRGGQRGQGRFGGGFFGGGFGTSRRDVALRTDVSKSLGLLDDQKEQIEELRREYRTAARDAMEDAGRDRDKMRAALGKVSKKFDGKLDDILLPHQGKRLTQIANQYQIRSRRGRGGATASATGTSTFLQTEDVVTKLSITDKQKEELKKKAEEINKEIAKKVAKLQIEAQEELLAVLSGSQRTQFKDMIGETFTFEQTQSRFGRGGGRGGQQRGRGGRGGQGGRTRPGRDDLN